MLGRLKRPWIVVLIDKVIVVAAPPCLMLPLPNRVRSFASVRIDLCCHHLSHFIKEASTSAISITISSSSLTLVGGGVSSVVHEEEQRSGGSSWSRCCGGGGGPSIIAYRSPSSSLHPFIVYPLHRLLVIIVAPQFPTVAILAQHEPSPHKIPTLDPPSA